MLSKDGRLRMPKRRLIKDPVWGNIELFSWETDLINHFIFNRLHNIVQNSSGYRAYPALKYSRFLHTIGVTHVVTQLLINSLINSPKHLLDDFKKEADQATEKLGSIAEEVLAEITALYPCAAEFASLLAVLRMTALLHDIGHLPYSHVFENALEGFLTANLDGVFDFDIQTIAKRDKLKDALHPPSTSSDNEPTKAHEIIGLMLAGELATEVGSAISRALIHEAIRILRDDGYPIATTFIKGTIDADRIDFVRRDGAFSGLFDSAVDYDRLFKLYTLAEVSRKQSMPELPNPVRHIVARPSLRAISESEKLLWERFQDYKYIVVHHKVHLYDEIVENILVQMMAAGYLNSFLDNIYYLFRGNNQRSLSGKRQQVYFLLAILLEFDDPWIENCIRGLYKKAILLAEDADIKTYRPLFEAYVEDREKFKTLFKSDDEFWADCKTFAPRLLTLRINIAEIGLSSNKRAYFFRALYGAKYKLQKLLQEEMGFAVLIGPTDKKVNYGIKNDEWAQFYGVEDLTEFLKAKKHDTMLFNCWYDSLCGYTREEVSSQILGMVSDFMMDAIDLIQGVKELPFGGSK